ncbi:COMM domain-containing 7 isoform X1 [Brachionus plicatilis]|uniref:COMM domain-containing 7 isoform X1 n=1 Tax=Brachionus plicatilis TaxID=10195 RepID=A0A3M7Q9P7_BRAPC|nr:COMM domain-containing 7 isoform X1 [Brachionus plicatilis]
MSEPTSEQLAVDFIKTSTDQDFKVLTEASTLFLTDRYNNDRLANLNKTIETIENSRSITKFLIKQISDLIQTDQPKVVKHFQSNFGLDDSKCTIIKSILEKYADQLKAIKCSQSLMIGQLVDMEWKFGVTASTSHVDKLGQAFLQIKLVFNTGDKVESRFMELTLPQFYSFLLEMNKARSQMDYLS